MATEPHAAGEPARSWKNLIFKNRGLLLVPVAIVLIVLGRPSLESAIVGSSSRDSANSCGFGQSVIPA